MNVLSFEVMWYSSSAYQILPNCELPTPHFFSLKSSVRTAGVVVFVLPFEAFAFTVTLALLLTSRLLTFKLLLFGELMLAKAIIMTTKPAPITNRAATPPRIHQIAFDFFGGALDGVGDHG